jgi:hypothetical protein
MAANGTPHTILDHLAGHPRADDLARLVHATAFAAAIAHKPRLSEGLAKTAERFDLSHADAETSFGNVLQALEQDGAKHAVLLGTLLARGVALSSPEGPDAERHVAEALLWMATHTGIDAFTALDATLGPRADGLFRALAALVREANAGSAPGLGRAGALVGAAALGSSPSRAARSEARALASETDDRLLQSLLRHSTHASDDGSAPVMGELSAAPRNPFVLVLLAVSGLLLVIWIGRLILTLLLRRRRHAELSVSASGVTVAVKTELFGRTIREQRIHYPIEALLYAAREVKYPRLSLYVGLLALALGSYFGISLFIDGARAGSPELLGIGALVVALGVALDFALTALPSIAQGTCRIVIVPRKGAALAVGQLDPAIADGALRRLIRS